MNLFQDMELFVHVVRCNGMAVAGRELGMTPANVTTRIKNLENHYKTKLLVRNTRSLTLTEQGREFYNECLHTLESVNRIESQLRHGQEGVAGHLRVSATSDLGRQHISPLLRAYVRKHSKVRPHMNLTDSVVDFTEGNIDLAFRYGIGQDGRLMAKKLADNRRVLCASPDYLRRAGLPEQVIDLTKHMCLTQAQKGRRLQSWFFNAPGGEVLLQIDPAFSSDDGAEIRHWALDGAGIALKSIWDVATDIEAGRLEIVLGDLPVNYQSFSSPIDSDLYLVWHEREFLPRRVQELIEFSQQYFSSQAATSHLLGGQS